ncbi:MAG: serine hydrolase domain-containing protein [Bacteroidales bacterium]
MKKLFFIPMILVALAITWSCTESPRSLTDATPESVNVSAERLARIDNMLQQAVDSGWIAGVTGFVARDGRIVYNKAFGFSSIESKVPMKTDDIFRIASQSKAIASTAVMMLFEEGKFLLDDPVSKYIPEFAHPVVLDQFNAKDTTYTTKPATREITIRDLLTHTSGIDYAGIGSPNMNAIYAKAGIPVGFESRKLLIGTEMKKLGKLPLVHNPGERWTYGLNIDVLGYLVEIWSGESFDQYLKKHLFEPLGMNDTYFYIPGEKANRLVAVHATDQSDKLVVVKNPMTEYPLSNGTYFSGGAGLSSTTKDYAAFLQMILDKGVYDGKRILSRKTIELMLANQIGNLSLGKDKFGLGFQITTPEGSSVSGMSEGSFSWGGYWSTTYWGDPGEKLVCLLFINQSPMNHGEVHGKFRSLIYQALTD